MKRSAPGEGYRYLCEVVLQYEGEDCLIWPYGRGADGYGIVRINGRATRVSRLSCEEENGPAPFEKMDAAHSCGNGHLGCCSRKHLRWATRLENARDAMSHDTHARGEINGNSKLTDKDVMDIRELRGKVTLRELSERYGVSQGSLCWVQKGKTWKHLNQGEN